MTVFTGIVEEVGTVTAVDRGRHSAVLTIQAHTVLEDAKVLDKAVLLSDIPVHREQKNEKCTLFDPHDPDALADLIVETAERADRPEEAAYFAGDMMAGMANMYREAGEYAKALEKIFV